MGERGPKPLHPTVRARTNTTSTAAELPVLTLEERTAIQVPELPADRLWDPKTSDFWVAAWQSPMRLEWDEGDLHKLLMTAYMLDEFYQLAGNPDIKPLDKVYGMHKAAKTVMDLCSKMGLDPYARRSLQWLLVNMEKNEAEADNARATAARTRAKTAKAATKTPRQKRGLKGLE